MTNRHNPSIEIKTETTYLADRSTPEDDRYLFSYQVRIINRSSETVQLKSRKWIITDENGGVNVVEGDGVVGEQPIIDPGDFFEYTSFCPFTTPSGSMRGTYHMTRMNSEEFDVTIEPFYFEAPFLVN